MIDHTPILSQPISQSEPNIHPHGIIGGNVNAIGLNLLNNSVYFCCKVGCSLMCLQDRKRCLLFRRGILPFLGGKYFLRHNQRIWG